MAASYDGLAQDQLIQQLQRRQTELEQHNQELLRAQQRLEDTCSRYADLYDLAPVGYLTFDVDGCVVEANLQAARLLDEDEAGLVGRPLAAIVAVDDPLAFHEHLRACRTHGKRVTTEIAITKAMRGPMALQMVSTPLRGPDGWIIGCRTTLTDISAIKRSEERLRLLAAAGELLGSSLDYAATLGAVARLTVPLLGDRCFVDVVEEDGRVARLHSRAPSEAEAPPQLLTPGELIDPMTPQDEVLRSGQALLLEHWPDGSLLVVPLAARGRTLGVLTCVMGESGRRHSASDLGLAQEVASRAAMAIDNARLYQTAQRAIRAREELLAIVSHDLESPLQGIRLNCEFLLSMASPDRDRRQGRVQLESIRRGVAGMHSMIGALADLSLIESGGLVLDPSEYDAAALVEEAFDLLRPKAARKEITLTRLPLERPVTVVCDRARIVRVLSSLVGNAIYFTAKAGVVTVRVVVELDEVRFVVEDNGVGIARARIPRLFDRHALTDPRQQRRGGIGLYLARSIVEAHGGTITIESEVGVGTVVAFTMPRVELRAPPGGDERPRPKA